LYLDGRYVAYSTTAFDFPPLGGPPVAGAVLTYFNQLDRAYSAFSQANYQIYGPVKLTAGLRYTKEQKSVDLARQVLQPGLFSVFVEPPYAPFSRSKSEDSVDGSIGLSYQLRRDTLLYTSWGQGTKAGGFAQAVSLLDKAEYQPEVARTTELGIKSQLDDRRWTVNVAGFYTAIRDFQLVSFDGVNFVVDNSNLRSSGIEAEIVWLPVRGLRLFANNTYADTLDTRHHTDTEFAPRWSGMGGGSFSWPAFGALQASLTLDLNYRSSELSQLAGVSAPRLSASKRLNASAGLGSPERGWEVRVLCKNLNNERTLGFAFPAPLEPPGNAAGMPLDPRTVWLQVSYKP
jgi:iron complex outermembrane receptor protein